MGKIALLQAPFWPLNHESFIKVTGVREFMRVLWLVVLLIPLVLVLGLANMARANTLKPFITDGCSLWIDGTPEQPNLWRHCCVTHDLAYWQGGTKLQRQQADKEILACVKQAQVPGMAKYIYTNVRWGGGPYWMSAYRWGYGWNYFDGAWPRGYKTPTAEEQAQIDALMPAALHTLQQDALLHPPAKATVPEALSVE
jgi:hypothetical protein